MYLPNAEAATLPPEKITHYLLVPDHPDNRGKAAFFFRYGFAMEDWETLAAALLIHGRMHPVTATRQRSQGMLYEVIGEMAMPDGRARRVLTAWFVPTEGVAPRFVTAYPA